MTRTAVAAALRAGAVLLAAAPSARAQPPAATEPLAFVPHTIATELGGAHVHEFADGGWTRTHVTAGDPNDWPASGASEAQGGWLGSERFVATIEPWHGHQVVVYRQAAAGGAWARHVLDPSIEDGHTVVVADFAGDGRDEIVAGERRGAKRSPQADAGGSGRSPV